MNKHRFFFSSLSFVRISYKTIWLKTRSWYKNPLKNESWKGLNRYFSKDAHQKSEVGQWGPIQKNSTPSPWKRRKTTSSAILRNGRLRVKMQMINFEKKLLRRFWTKIRAIRNKRHHQRDLTDEARRELGTSSESFFKHWNNRFPLLLPLTYKDWDF